MFVETLLALVRHGLTAGGSFFVVEGMATTMQIENVAGAAVTIAGFGWSMWRKWKRQSA